MQVTQHLPELYPCQHRPPSCSPSRSKCCRPHEFMKPQTAVWRRIRSRWHACTHSEEGLRGQGRLEMLLQHAGNCRGVQLEHAEHHRLHPSLFGLTEVLHLARHQHSPASAAIPESLWHLISGFEAARQGRRGNVDLKAKLRLSPGRSAQRFPLNSLYSLYPHSPVLLFVW